ncbi:MAG: GGDEF domain-containing protein, partial [Solirubrobacteraceae bacterium]|nr:GGDEF domain-containing protein [Solirubrobacteraceae bacterium]
AVISSAVRRASMEHRTAAVIDPLTGMLNRTALETRATELRHQSSQTGERVGMLVLDLDHFKHVNDTYGHAIGDQVLQETAYRLRKRLRAFDLAYRVGGEEFVILLPGADTPHAEGIAEELRCAVRAEPVAGVDVTVSVGVAISETDRPFSFEQVFDAADEALYAAKDAGRDRVCVAGQPVAGLVAA